MNTRTRIPLFAKSLTKSRSWNKGKTYQTCTLLAGLMRSRKIRNALIVCPVAVMKTWEKEAKLIIEKLCGIGTLSLRIVDSSIKRERRAMMLEEALLW